MQSPFWLSIEESHVSVSYANLVQSQAPSQPHCFQLCPSSPFVHKSQVYSIFLLFLLFFLPNVFGLPFYLCKLGIVPFWDGGGVVFLRAGGFSLVKILFISGLSGACKFLTVQQSWINYGGTVQGCLQCHCLCYKYKNKRKTSFPKYAHYVLKLGTLALCIRGSVFLFYFFFSSRMEAWGLLWDSETGRVFWVPECQWALQNIFLGFWSSCTKHPRAWFVFIKGKTVLFFIPITCCSKWLKSFKDSKCWKTAVCWCEQHV